MLYMITDKAEKLVKKRANEVLKNYIEPVYTSRKLPEEPQPRLVTLRETLLGFFQKLRNYWQWQMLIIQSDLYQRNQEKLKANYCDEGWHQQNKCSGSISNGKRKFKYEYIECPICGIKFFPTVKDKHNYMRSTRPMRKLIKGLMK